MSFFWRSLSLFVAVFFVCGELSAVSAATPLKMEKKSGSAAGSAVQAKVKKTTGIVKTIDASTLVLQDGRKYLLKDVKILFPRGGRRAKVGKQLAEMMFVNDRLVEIVVK